MPKFQSPLLGYNNNVRHKGRVFHIQTEDSGVKHPHVITHLFADGGRILKSTKTSYGEQINQPNIEEVIRGIMKEQHKAMFIALRDGAFDHLFDPNAPKPPEGKEIASPSPPPPPVATPAPIPIAPAPPATPVPAPRAATPAPAAAAPAARVQVAMHPTEPARKRISQLPPPVTPLAARGRSDQTQAAQPAAKVSTPQQPAVDMSTLERAAEAASEVPFQQVRDLPPPPAAVLKRRGTPGRSLTPTVAPAPPDLGTHSAGRYAVSRPSTIFATSRPQEGMSIFGEDLISEKTLDEVILSYLADDLDPGEGGGGGSR